MSLSSAARSAALLQHRHDTSAAVTDTPTAAAVIAHPWTSPPPADWWWFGGPVAGRQGHPAAVTAATAEDDGDGDARMANDQGDADMDALLDPRRRHTIGCDGHHYNSGYQPPPAVIWRTPFVHFLDRAYFERWRATVSDGRQPGFRTCIFSLSLSL